MDATGPLGHSPASFGWGPPKSDPSRLACEILFSRAAGVNTPAPSMNSFYKRNQLLPPPTTASLRNTCLNLPNRLILFFFFITSLHSPPSGDARRTGCGVSKQSDCSAPPSASRNTDAERERRPPQQRQEKTHFPEVAERSTVT